MIVSQYLYNPIVLDLARPVLRIVLRLSYYLHAEIRMYV